MRVEAFFIRYYTKKLNKVRNTVGANLCVRPQPKQEITKYKPKHNRIFTPIFLFIFAVLGEHIGSPLRY